MNDELNFIKDALKEEYTAIQIYQALVNASNIPSLKQLFTSLANDEQRHVHLLQSMYYQLTGQSYYPQIGNPTANKHAEQLIDESIEDEINDFKKYSQAAASTNYPNFSKLYQQMANDENVHTLKLLNLQK